MHSSLMLCGRAGSTVEKRTGSSEILHYCSKIATKHLLVLLGRLMEELDYVLYCR